MSAEKTIHILYFIHDLSPFGAQRAVYYTLKYLDRKRFRVTVCSFWGDETMAPEFAKCGAEVFLLRAKRYFDPFAWAKFFFFLIRLHPDIICTTLPELGFPVRMISLLLPYLNVIHCFQNPLSSEPQYWQFLNRVTLSLCDAVTFSSKGIVEEVAVKVPSLKDRFFVIQNGVELNVLFNENEAILCKELYYSTNEKKICCVGRLDKQKGQDILIDALALLISKRIKIRLFLVGEGPMYHELKEKVRHYGLEEKVSFLGRRHDIAHILSYSDIYVAPSRWESFNIALGEAMLSGKPCVATAIPGHTDLLIDGVTGLAVPMNDAAALARGIVQLLERSVEARIMASTATELVKTKFTTHVMAKKYEKLYLSLAR
jgi:glycosyltransferase involved in cell wall biosynthesis